MNTIECTRAARANVVNVEIWVVMHARGLYAGAGLGVLHSPIGLEVQRLLRGSVILSPDSRRAQLPPTLEHADAPENLSPIAAELWSDIQAELCSCGLMTPLDTIALEMLCECYADWAEARAEMALCGGRYITVRDADGNPAFTRMHPAVNWMRKAERSLKMWLDAFGMTPTARLRWSQPADGPDAGPSSPPLDLSGLTQEERQALGEMMLRRMGGGRDGDELAVAGLRPDTQSAPDDEGDEA